MNDLLHGCDNNWYVNFDTLKQPFKYLYSYMYKFCKAVKEFVLI